MRPVLVSLENCPSIDELMSDNLFIFTRNKEPRSQHIFNLYQEKTASCWCILESTERVEEVKAYTSLIEKIETILLPELPKKLELRFAEAALSMPRRIVVDISCMSRRLMASIFEAIFYIAESEALSVGVIYSLAKFAAPPEALPINKDICPVSQRFAGWPSNAELPTSLVVGLGYEQEKAEGACEYFDPREVWVFSPVSPIVAYDKEVYENNKSIIQRAEMSRRFMRFKVDDPAQTFGDLVNAAMSLITRSNPVLLPFGPKIFFAVSLFVSLIFEEVGIWIVTGDLNSATESEASDHLISFEAHLTPSKHAS